MADEEVGHRADGATTSPLPEDADARCSVLGFFVITVNATVVNVALPSIRAELDGGLTGPE